MSDRVCRNCGVLFESNGDRVLCPACTAKSKSNVMRDRVCTNCRKTFLGGPRASYCPDCRKEHQRETTRQCRILGPMRKLGSIDRCEACGKEYTVNSGRQKYCKDCAKEAAKAVDRKQKLKNYHENKSIINPVRNARRKKVISVCEKCGNVFFADGRKTRLCPSCYNPKKYAKKIEYIISYPDGEVHGFVLAKNCGDHYEISKQQFDRACKKSPSPNYSCVFHGDKPVCVDGKYI